ncbi:MAG: bifunctional nuclease family protein [Gemmatimonadetes bacterium]|nr:bifunctional nuclease family protein [Gemmatimonadota bacterium]
MLVDLTVARLGLDSATNSYVVILRERGGRRLLPIWIGQAEAESIAAHLGRVRRERPMTHDLCRAVIAALGGSLRRVVITRVHNGTYYAELQLVGPSGVAHVDARPSDGIAVALRCQAPIAASDALLVAPDDDEEEGGESADLPEQGPTPAGELTPEELKAYLANLRPEDFGRFLP